MQKLVFNLLLLLASSWVDAADLCMSVISDPGNRSLNRDEQVIMEPLPVYPRRPEVERGYVDVEFRITAEGTVRDPIVLISIPAGLFDEVALDAVRMFRYKPRIVDGRAVVVEGVQKRISFIPSGQDEPEDGKSAKKKKKQAKAVSKEVFDKINLAQKMIDAVDYSGALRMLEVLLQYEKLNEFEKSNVLNYIAFVYYSMDDYGAAIATYEEMLRIPSLEEKTRKQTQYTLLQLNMLQDRYTVAIRLMEEWFTLEPNPTSEQYLLYAQNLAAVTRYRDMIKPIETAIRIAEKSDKPVEEDWYRLLRYATSKNEELQTALDISKEMNNRWPGEENSYELAMSWLRLGNRNEAHAALRELLASWPETDYVTPLHLAAADGDTTLIAELLANGADVNDQSQDDSTPLHWAGRFGQVEAVNMLIDAKADVNAKSTIDLTAMHQATQDGYSLIVETLVAAGADVNAVTKSVANTPLLLAVIGKHTSVVEKLISAGADVNAGTAVEITALHKAAIDGPLSIVEMLIAAGADVNAVTKSEMNTPLLLAVTGKHTSVVELLISAGADVNANNEENLTILHSAAKNSEATIVELLIAAGAHVNARSESDRTPLHQAARSGNTSVVKMLIAAGAELDPKGNDGWTPLTWAAYSGHASVVDILIAAGAEIDPRSEGDWTPLSWAAFWGDDAVATRLIDHGADVAGVEKMAELVARAGALLGSLYAQGLGVEQDDSLALRWYRAAAELGNADAAYALGEMYLTGRGIRTSKKKATQWFQAAAHQGHRDAQVRLSESYLNGVGVRKDLTEASMWSCLAGA